MQHHLLTSGWFVISKLVWQRVSLECLALMTLAQIARDRGSIPRRGTDFFQITNCHLFHPLFHLAANVISEVEMYEDMCLRWSSSYDAHLDSKRPGFDPLLRHRTIIRPTVTLRNSLMALWGIQYFVQLYLHLSFLHTSKRISLWGLLRKRMMLMNGRSRYFLFHKICPTLCYWLMDYILYPIFTLSIAETVTEIYASLILEHCR